MHDENEPLHDPLQDPLPDTLRNWQVLEIDGQATPVAEPAPVEAEDAGDLQIGDRQDDIIVVTLDNRCRQVEPGSTVEYNLTVLNNGPHKGSFVAQVEGWIDPRWAGDNAPSVVIEPDRRATLSLSLVVPRKAESEAGDYHFAITVRSKQYPDHTARVGARLTVLPFDAIEAHFLDLPERTVNWAQRSTTLPLSVTNQGNHPAHITVEGGNPRHQCRFTFGAPADTAAAAAVDLQPRQSITLPVRIEVRRPPLAGLQPRELDVHVVVKAREQAAAGVRTHLLARPLIGPWQMAAVMGLAAVGALTLLLVGTLAFLLAQRTALQQPAAAAVPALAAPPVIIVTLNQPADSGTRNSLVSPGNRTGAGPAASSAPDPSLPLVLPDQVTAPNGTAPALAPALGPPAAGGPAAAAPNSPGSAAGGSAAQTYGQMFQAVGSRFDLDWRMLAAQAYVESGFDALALSDSGAMGLMQVQPDTWREWAPAVEASDPFDANSSVLVAGAYLDYLRSRLAGQGHPETEWMLVAYNWGPDKLNNFLEAGGTWDTLPEVRRQYASEILRIAKSIP